MSLIRLGGQLLRRGMQLASSAACCCTAGLFCRQIPDDCGNPVNSCGASSEGATGPCTPDCVPPSTPCECGPLVACPECYECVDRACRPIEDCCQDDSNCPECSRCENGTCTPCGECQQCINGACVPCGACQTCEGGECVPCPEDCVEGECGSRNYYCCYTDCPQICIDGDCVDTDPDTYCAPEVQGPNGPESPCGKVLVGDPEVECDLTKSGPFPNSEACDIECRRYECVTGCGTPECVQDPDGQYASYEECLEACADPCAQPCSLSGGPQYYSIDACERDVCVSYVSLNSRPIRVQIYGPILSNGCPIPGTRVIKLDSLWRCGECCDCPDQSPRSNDPRPCAAPSGTINWTKPQNVTAFEVVVLSACGASYELSVGVTGDPPCDPCGELPEAGPCPCATNADCHDCLCCEGECEDKDCTEEIECEEPEDCPVYYVVGSIGECVDFCDKWFCDEGAAFAFAMELIEAGCVGAPVVTPVFGLCCSTCCGAVCYPPCGFEQPCGQNLECPPPP